MCSSSHVKFTVCIRIKQSAYHCHWWNNISLSSINVWIKGAVFYHDMQISRPDSCFCYKTFRKRGYKYQRSIIFQIWCTKCMMTTYHWLESSEDIWTPIRFRYRTIFLDTHFAKFSDSSSNEDRSYQIWWFGRERPTKHKDGWYFFNRGNAVCCWHLLDLGYQGPLLLTWFNFNPSMDK